ncbi:hypothetical protein LEP1GSC038_1693 [Leptospira weilii str. 2006001855]|uniref:Uncharacterized protein n=2 Tax=Leptospira weilii TaxID=28184 RepID=M6QR77_9LEPT|nr:hypothetical protein [Leptospira weilii]EMM70971.1 hypothetical protein LEP1GSC038_1693 [Leptospira weilii str. 2006001855]EMN45164.1 hypothetical protein LEP1GSC086_1224 [Leptospira weilii str. LNT 1234]EMN91332.1 hypothetical protein LEP1GSC108_3147 [Leptospira weilii str. UI 13098]OMI17482.1 hypothetical protein BUQ74_09735 [Leptospira weilii serovar Heyan]QDK27232.1 hypothetical protein FHG68_11585 [Leptospira weilii]
MKVSAKLFFPSELVPAKIFPLLEYLKFKSSMFTIQNNLEVFSGRNLKSGLWENRGALRS